jgi:dipeptidase
VCAARILHCVCSFAGAFRLLSPSSSLPSSYGNLKDDAPYPFSLPAGRPLAPADLMAVHRDWYEGTEFSPAGEGVLAGGPYGSPDRWSGGRGEMHVDGNWERTIALFRTSASIVVQSRSWLPNEVGGVVWFAPHAAHSSSFVPIMPGAMLQAPLCLSRVYQGVYDMSTSFWAHRNILSIAQIKFSYMIVDIKNVQKTVETESQDLVNSISSKYSTSSLSDADKEDINLRLTANAEKVRDAFLQLAQDLLFRYADGFINAWTPAGFTSAHTGYPAWWLEAVGYTDGPPPVGAAKSLPGTKAGVDNRENDQVDAEAPLDACLKGCIAQNDRRSVGAVSSEASLKECTLTCLN